MQWSKLNPKRYKTEILMFLGVCAGRKGGSSKSYFQQYFLVKAKCKPLQGGTGYWLYLRARRLWTEWCDVTSEML